MPCLTRLGGPEGSQQFAVFKAITSIGSAPSNDVVLNDGSVAEYHAQLVFDGKHFNLAEIDGEAELKINGKRKRRARLVHNDRLHVGDVELVFSLLDGTGVGDEREDSNAPNGSELSGLARLHEFSMRLMEIRSVDTLLESLLDAVIEITHADKGFVILLEDTRPKITVARNLRGENLSDGIRHLSDSIIAKVIENKRAVIVSDALKDEVFSKSESVMSLKLCSVMCAPLMSQGQLLGVLYVGNDSVANLFVESSLDVMSVFAGQASLILQNALLLDQLRTDRDQLAEQLENKRFGDIIGSSPSLLEVFAQIEKVAPIDISVLVTGETGTGKELIAAEIHRRSGRGAGPFVAVNCGAIPENLMESELFGHVKGAFTGAIATHQGRFQQANGGTLFLDEIGELPLSLQVKLLRALQEHEVSKVGDSQKEKVDIRVIAATHRDLQEEIKKSRFREDLYYRLNVVHLHLPPLRERGEDVIVLAKYLLEKFVQEFKSEVRGFTPNAIIALRKYPWPGNVRQLENRIKKAIVLCDKTLVGPEDLELGEKALEPIKTLAQAREDFQRSYIHEVLELNGGNRTKTAQDLGVDPRTVFRYLEKGGPDIE
ncbi:MAG: sigma 54-interacting transcriptional regulator [Myxococcales bacterium]|nr:MAG: sigma 54-interacting transcriptional regulator [Myxococcales bacterium]